MSMHKLLESQEGVFDTSSPFSHDILSYSLRFPLTSMFVLSFSLINFLHFISVMDSIFEFYKIELLVKQFLLGMQYR